MNDPDVKGAVEATVQQEELEDLDHPGLDDGGLPNDALAIAQDVLGADEDKSQG